MNILVTGASGFMGRSFCEFASKTGCQVTALTRTPSEFSDSGITAVQYDFLQSDPSTLALDHIDAVFHPAWIATPGEYWTSPLNQHFLEASLRFSESLSNVPSPPLLCVAGTCAEYLAQNSPLTENSPLNTTSQLPYINSKIKLHSQLAERYPKLSWARIFYPYGPGEHPSRLVSSAIEAMKNGEIFKLNAPHFQKDYIYIDDLSSAILSVFYNQLQGAVNIGTGTGTPLGLMLQKTTDFLPFQADVITPETADLPPLEITIADIRRLASTGWEPQTDLTEGLKKLVLSLA